MIKRYCILIKKEILSTTATLSFHIIALISPVLFLFVFTSNLKNDISFPVRINGSREFQTHVLSFTSPGGSSYFHYLDEENMITITENRNITLNNGVLTGDILLEVNSIDANITKNYRNRLTGVLSRIVSSSIPEIAITVEEIPVYSRDPPWSAFFGSSIFIFAIIFSGFLFGSFSFTEEWDNHMITLFKLSPVAPAHVILAKFLSVFIKVQISLLFYLSISAAIAKTPIPPKIIILMVTGSVLAIPPGMLVGVILKNKLVTFLVSLIASITLWAFGGGFGTAGGMAPLVQTLMSINPVSSLVKLVLHINFSGPFEPFLVFYPLILGVILFLILFERYRDLIKNTKYRGLLW